MSQNWLVAYFEPNKYIAVQSPNGATISSLEYECGRAIVVIGVCHTLDYKTFSSLGYDGFLAWSADGKRLAIASDCNIHLWAPGESLIALLDENTCGYFMHPDWSPDGNFIVYTSQELLRVSPSGQVYLPDVFLASIDGTVHRPLMADFKGASSSPDWSPDGRRIAFESSGIFVYSLDTNEAINLTPGRNGENPAWSPDGQFIAYTTSHDGHYDLNIMQADGKGSRKVAELGNERTYLLQWLADGKYILHNSSLIDMETGMSHLLRLDFEPRNMTWFTPVESVSQLPVPTPHCASGWSRLDMGAYAIVTGGPNAASQKIYAWAGADAEVKAQIAPGQIVRVWHGPTCADGLVFWNVESDALHPNDSGVMAEGDGATYYLEPYQPQP